MGGAAEWHLVLAGCRVLGKLKALGSGSVLGLPLKRAEAHERIPGNNFIVSRGLEREHPEAQPLGEGHEGSVEPMAALASSGHILCRVREPHERDGLIR
jgi:hypothetical protein